MHCIRCGTQVPEGARFCLSCGSAVTDPGAATVAIATATEEDAFLAALKADLGDEYDIERELGRGGMAVVYKAVERDLQRTVALKVLPAGTSPDMAERFKREARMAAQLEHPNVVPVYRVGQAAGTHFFAMKFVEGRPLDAIIEAQGALTVPVVLHILRGAVAGLAFAHERNIVHRDIKGANVLIERDGRVLLSDLGIARALEEKKLTATGAVIGTPHFMSPEQCSGDKVGPQTDQYSMGVLAFQMLSGQVPFDGDSIMGILHHHFFTAPPDLRTVREGVPEELLAVMYKALAKLPEERFPTTRDMLRAIEAIPFSEAERFEAEDSLRQLAAGEKLPQVRTGSLPPAMSTATGLRVGNKLTPTYHAGSIGTGAKPGLKTVKQEPLARAKSRKPLMIGGAIALVAAGAVAVVFMRPKEPAVPIIAATATTKTDSVTPLAPADSGPRPAASIDATAAVVTATTPKTTSAASTKSERPRRAALEPPAEPAPSGTGLLRISTSPPDAVIRVDGRQAGQGMLIDHEIPAGRRRIRITAAGHVPFDTTINVAVGATVNLGRRPLKPEGAP